MRNISASVASLFLVGCATAPGAPNNAFRQLKETFASDDPCSSNARNIGIVGGALTGILLANAVGNGKNESRIIGAAVGGLVGGLVGADMDRKRCELSKVAKKYALDMTFAEIKVESGTQESVSQGEQTKNPRGPQTSTQQQAQQPSTQSAQAASNEVIGNAVTVRDKEGAAGHFESGSDRLTPGAQVYFSAIAEQYSPDTVLAAQSDARHKEDASKQLSQRRLLLIGHTDDTGPSQLNAVLSERRARAVAALLRGKGVPEGSIYYQGAGETLPIADNRTEAGREANRRVEIVELASEAGFQKYLDNRKPQYGFYRHEPQPATSSTTASVSAPSVVEHNNGAAAVAVQSNKTSPSAAQFTKPDTASTASADKTPRVGASAATKVATAPLALASPNLDFGGSPYTVKVARINTGLLVPERTFGLISTAQADDSVLTADCSYDRPRNTGQVKSLRDGSVYKTSEHLPQLYGKTWATDVNGNLVVINRLAVLRNGTTPANLPELKVYAQYKPGNGKKPDVVDEPQVNAYRVDKGVLYRMFPRNARGMQCMDMLFALDGSTTARAGKLIYSNTNGRYVADFNPQLQ